MKRHHWGLVVDPKESPRSVSQIDFVPSFALMSGKFSSPTIGIPIPYANLGSIIPELFVADSLDVLVKATRATSLQIYSYISSYAKVSSELNHTYLSLLFSEAERKHAQHLIKLHDKSTRNQLIESSINVFKSHTLFQRSCLTAARQVWAQFNITLIVMGCIVLFFAILQQIFPRNFSSSLAFVAAACGLGTWIIPFPQTKPLQSFLFTSTTTYLFLSISYPVGSIIIKLSKTLSKINLTHSLSLLSKAIPNATLLVSLLHIATPGSDSYTYWEDWATFYLLQTLCLIRLTHLYAAGKSIDLTVGLLMLNRIAVSSTICRQEQGPSCTPSFYERDSSVAALYTLPLLLLAQICVIGVVKYTCLNFKQSGMFLGAIVVGITTAVTYSVADTLESHGYGTYPALKLYGARIGGSVALLISVFDLTFTTEVKDRRGSLKGFSKVTAKLYKVTLMIYVITLYVQKPMGGIMLGIGLLRLHCLMHDTHPSIWASYYLVGLSLFFSTGHQTIFSSLQMDTGFFGLSRVNWILTPLFIFINTFGGVALAASSLVLHNSYSRYDLLLGYKGLIHAAVFSSALFTAHFRRHLMVWGVFAPRFMFCASWAIVGLIVLQFGSFLAWVFDKRDLKRRYKNQ